MDTGRTPLIPLPSGTGWPRGGPCLTSDMKDTSVAATTTARYPLPGACTPSPHPAADGRPREEWRAPETWAGCIPGPCPRPPSPAPPADPKVTPPPTPSSASGLFHTLDAQLPRVPWGSQDSRPEAPTVPPPPLGPACSGFLQPPLDHHPSATSHLAKACPPRGRICISNSSICSSPFLGGYF